MLYLNQSKEKRELMAIEQPDQLILMFSEITIDFSNLNVEDGYMHSITAFSETKYQ